MAEHQHSTKEKNHDNPTAAASTDTIQGGEEEKKKNNTAASLAHFLSPERSEKHFQIHPICASL